VKFPVPTGQSTEFSTPQPPSDATAEPFKPPTTSTAGKTAPSPTTPPLTTGAIAIH
jgi:hypothetical protein